MLSMWDGVRFHSYRAPRARCIGAAAEGTLLISDIRSILIFRNVRSTLSLGLWKCSFLHPNFSIILWPAGRVRESPGSVYYFFSSPRLGKLHLDIMYLMQGFGQLRKLWYHFLPRTVDFYSLSFLYSDIGYLSYLLNHTEKFLIPSSFLSGEKPTE